MRASLGFGAESPVCGVTAPRGDHSGGGREEAGSAHQGGEGLGNWPDYPSGKASLGDAIFNSERLKPLPSSLYCPLFLSSWGLKALPAFLEARSL